MMIGTMIVAAPNPLVEVIAVEVRAAIVVRTLMMNVHNVLHHEIRVGDLKM
jgi:hypothetical protein